MCPLQNTKNPGRECASFLLMGNMRYNSASFPLEGLSSHDSDLRPKIFTDEDYFMSCEPLCLTSASKVLAPFCLSGPPLDVSDKMECKVLYNIQYVQFPCCQTILWQGTTTKCDQRLG